MKENTKAILSRLVTEEQGIQHAEEALLLALIAVVSVLAVRTLGETITGVFQQVNTDMS